MKDEPRLPSKHQHEHAVPTVIHNPEQDLPVLARWVYHAMEDRTRFWSVLAALVVIVVGLAALSNGLTAHRTTANEAWTRLALAKNPAERVEIASEFRGTPAESWALLQAATEYYAKGFGELPANREAALPDMKKALELFEKVATEAPKDSPQARAAAFGAARTLEARHDLSKAIERYEQVAKTWPNSDEGRQSERLAKLLRKPETVKFYNDLYAYKPTEVTLPPGGQGGLTIPPLGRPPGGTNVPESILLPAPPVDVSKKAATPTQGLPKLPDDVFAPSTPSPAGTDGKAGATKSPSGEIPLEVFGPDEATSKSKPADAKKP
jgi:tetratricopeptide (TPR) repeat protein